MTVTGSCISPNILLSSACRHNIITAAQSLSTFLVVVCVSGDGLLGVGGPGPGAVQLVEPLDTREVGQNCPVPQIEVHRPRLREADQHLQPEFRTNAIETLKLLRAPVPGRPGVGGFGSRHSRLSAGKKYCRFVRINQRAGN